jgi:hypothetical protein
VLRQPCTEELALCDTGGLWKASFSTSHILPVACPLDVTSIYDRNLDVILLVLMHTVLEFYSNVTTEVLSCNEFLATVIYSTTVHFLEYQESS